MQQDASILNKQMKLERLFSAYEQKMYALAYAVLHDEGQAEDAVMAAFERIVRAGRVPQEAQSAEAKRLVLRIVKQTAIDQYRKNARERAVYTSTSTEQLEALAGTLAIDDVHATGATGPTSAAKAADTPSAEGSMSAEAETNEEFENLLTPLTPPYQAVLRERFGNERSVRETAQKLGISEANVRKRQQRALAHLKQEYEANL